MVVAMITCAMPAAAQDGTKVDSKHYKVEFDNDQVRVLRITYGAGGLAVFLTDADVKFTLPDGQTREAHAKAGTIQWDAGGKHLPENIGTKGFEVILVELKSK